MNLLDGNYKNYGEESADIERVKHNHIYLCLKLKDVYKAIYKLSKRNLQKIEQMRGEVVTQNREFQGFMETEIDEEM